MTKTQLYIQGDYLQTHPTWHIEDSPWKAKQVLKIINKNQLYLNSICEIGCGVGEILNQLHSQLPDNIYFAGYEISPQAFELCQTREQTRLKFYFTDLLHEQEAFFDLALCLDVFEHIPDYLGFLEAFRKKARYKIFHIPLDISVSTVMRESILLQSWKRDGHIHFFTKEIALSALRDTGYKIIDYFYTPYYVEAPKKSLKASLMMLPRKLMFGLNQDIAVRLLGGYPLLVLAE